MIATTIAQTKLTAIRCHPMGSERAAEQEEVHIKELRGIYHCGVCGTVEPHIEQVYGRGEAGVEPGVGPLRRELVGLFVVVHR